MCVCNVFFCLLRVFSRFIIDFKFWQQKRKKSVTERRENKCSMKDIDSRSYIAEKKDINHKLGCIDIIDKHEAIPKIVDSGPKYS